MEEGIDDLMNKVSLGDDGNDGDEVLVDEECAAKHREVGKLSLIGKLLLLKLYGSIVERARVFFKQPWSFNKALLVLEEIIGDEVLEDMILKRCPFWVQLHRIPLNLMSNKVGIVFEEKISDVEELETGKDCRSMRKWMRVRVNIDITKPLKKDCDKVVEFKMANMEVVKNYGLELQADGTSVGSSPLGSVMRSELNKNGLAAEVLAKRLLLAKNRKSGSRSQHFAGLEVQAFKSHELDCMASVELGAG
ncbi:hypothetical protein PTKIN_Ptkin12aG0131700 [Pterospermum kingtungense]